MRLVGTFTAKPALITMRIGSVWALAKLQVSSLAQEPDTL